MNCEPEKIKIIYNPYAQKAAYKRWSNGAWIDLGSSSALSEERYQNGITLQNCGIDIVNKIISGYDDGTIGVNLVFEGTDNDYEDFQSILKLYFSDCKISCTRDEKQLISADQAAQKIESIFEDMEHTFEKYPNDELKAQIERYKETVKATVTVCILGTYSAGKSAFINALIGEEILPCASDPTTATVYRVHTSQENKIAFDYKNQYVELQFSEREYKPNTNNMEGDTLLSMVKENIANGAIHSCNAHMYYALEAINNFTKDTQSNSDTADYPTIIDVYVPFHKSSLPLDTYDFVFIDTPGADSETFKEHLDVTRDSLKSQTCGLPIIITKPDDMDKAGNALVNNLLENNGGALDISNTIVIVNQSDDKTPKTLREKKAKIENLCIARWHSNRIFFVSAAMGIAGKKADADDDESWIDGDLYQVYDDKQQRFDDPTHKNYTQLYQYDIISENRLRELCRQADAAPESERVLYNSGICSVEDEIGLFAQKYAAYNKCTQAQQYLQQAIEIAKKLTEKAQSEAETIRQQLNQNIDEKADSLNEELKESCENLKKDVPQKTASYITERALSTQIIDDLIKQLAGIWEKIKKDKSIKGGKARREMLSRTVAPQYSNAVKAYLNQLQNIIEESASSASLHVKDALCKVVNESNFVNSSDRSKLSHIILNYPHIVVPPKIELSQTTKINHYFLWIPWEKDETISKNNMHEFVYQQFRQHRSEYMSTYTKKYQDSLTQWIDALCFEIMSNLSNFSPALRSLNSKLQATIQEQSQLRIQQKKLLNNRDTIKNLLEIEEEY